MRDRFVGEELQRQIELAVAEPQPVQDHRHRRRADAHPLMLAHICWRTSAGAHLLAHIQRIHIGGQLDLAAHSGHNPQVI
jgi:hypothetical protein